MAIPESITEEELTAALRKVDIYTGKPPTGVAKATWPDSLAYDLFEEVGKLREPPEPEYWPPQVGDIWEAQGEEYVASKAYNDTDLYVQAIELEEDGYSYTNMPHYAKNLNDFKALKPILMRRRNMGEDFCCGSDACNGNGCE